MGRWIAVIGMTVVLGGCARTMMLNDPPERRPPMVDAEKWFVVTVRTNGESCDIQVHPDVDQGNDDVKVKRHWRVAWFFLNTCTNAKGATPKIDFYFTPTGSEPKDETTLRTPVRWRTETSTVLYGRVQPRGSQMQCKDDPDGPCGRYRYTVHVGKFSFDPDWEIVVF